MQYNNTDLIMQLIRSYHAVDRVRSVQYDIKYIIMQLIRFEYAVKRGGVCDMIFKILSYS